MLGLLRVFHDSLIECKRLVEPTLAEEVLDVAALAMLEIGTIVFQAAVRALYREHGWDEAGARVDGGGEAEAVAVGCAEVRRKTLE